MRLLNRYIFKSVISTSLVSLLVLLVLEMFFTLLKELENLGDHDYGIGEIIRYLLLLLPKLAYETFPMALLVGGLLGMGALANGSELVVMRAAGISIVRLVWAGLRAGLVLGLVALVLGEFVSPHMERMARDMRALARGQPVLLLGGRGFWARDGRFYINVRSVEPGTMPDIRLSGIYVYEIGDESELISVTKVEGAHFVEGRWILYVINRSVIERERIKTESLHSITLDSALNPEILKVLASDPADMPMRDLRTYIQYLEQNGLDSDPYRLAFWTKAIAPLTNLVMLLIAMPFAFGSQRSASTGQRLLIGVLLGLVFFLANRMLSNVVLLYGYPPVVGAALPTAVFFGMAIFALKRVR